MTRKGMKTSWMRMPGMAEVTAAAQKADRPKRVESIPMAKKKMMPQISLPPIIDARREAYTELFLWGRRR